MEDLWEMKLKKTTRELFMVLKKLLMMINMKSSISGWSSEIIKMAIPSQKQIYSWREFIINLSSMYLINN